MLADESWQNVQGFVEYPAYLQAERIIYGRNVPKDELSLVQILKCGDEIVTNMFIKEFHFLGNCLKDSVLEFYNVKFSTI